MGPNGSSSKRKVQNIMSLHKEIRKSPYQQFKSTPERCSEEEGMAKELEAKKALFGLTVKELGFGLSVIILIIGVIIYILFDKEIKVEKIHYFRELPYELEPEVLQYIYYGKAKSNSFYIGVLNLIKLGVYKLENTVNKVGKETQKIIYNPNHTAKLKAYQQKMVQSLNGFLEEDEQNIKSLD